MTERPILTDEKLREMAASFNNPRVRSVATELLALRAEREKLEAAVERWRKELCALCEDTEDRHAEIAAKDIEGKMGAYARGRIREAKSIRKAMGEVMYEARIRLAQPAESEDSWSMHTARLEEANGDPEISCGLHLTKPTEQQCDCCGQMKECENIVALGMDTTACQECREAGAKP